MSAGSSPQASGRIGIDVGGTKIAGVLLDAQGRTLQSRRVPSPQSGYAAVIEAIAGMVEELEADAPPSTTVGIGTPGALSPVDDLMQNCNALSLNGRPLFRDLEARLGRTLRWANDADCFALSEATDGAGKEATTVFGVILGTGAGGGFVVHGRLLQGPNAIAGEWGHNPLPWPREAETPGPRCDCGKQGCIETFLSGPALARDYQAHGGDGIDAEEIAKRAQAGEGAASACLERYVHRLARGLASIINVLDPSVIVLGGGLSNIEAIYQRVPELLPEFVFARHVQTPLRRARHGDASGVRGAAWLWPPPARP